MHASARDLEKEKNVRAMLGVALALALGFPGAAGAADEEVRACLLDARSEARLCVDECREQYRMDVDACRNLDHGCADVCRIERNECLVDVYEGIETCRAGCAEAAAAGVRTCEETTEPGSAERARCLKRVRVAHYRCTHECRDGAGDALKACRRAHRACLSECRIEAESETTAD